MEEACVFDFSHDLGNPGTWPKLPLQTLLLLLFIILQMSCALSFMYLFSQCLLKTYYVSEGSTEDIMVSKIDAILDFTLPTVWSFSCVLFHLFVIPCLPPHSTTPRQQGKLLLIYKIQLTLLPPLSPSSTTWG